MHEKINPLVSIILVVQNGAHWLRLVLDAISEQTYPNLEVVVRDNASTDATREIVQCYSSIKLIAAQENVGPWVGFERTLEHTKGDYVMLLTDVIMDAACITQAIETLERDHSIGAVQTKIFHMDLCDGQAHYTNRIDTTGFQVSRSRRVTNRGHGAYDHGQYDTQPELIAVEGAMPLFRRSALEASRIDGWLVDPAYRVGSIGYGDDLDVAWRMRLFGFRQVYVPTAIAWHDRSTTTGIATTPVIGQIQRRAERLKIPLAKRRLDWSNVRFTIIKNDSIMNILRDLPYILIREIAVFGYTILFEPAVLQEAARFLRLLPTMIRRRRQIVGRTRVPATTMRRFFL